jgi:hypothetical protein
MAKRKASRRDRPASGGAARDRRQAPARKASSAARKAVAKKRPASRPTPRKVATRRTAPKASVVRRASRVPAKASAAKSKSATTAALKVRRTTTPPRNTAVAPKRAKPQPTVAPRKAATAARPKLAPPTKLAPPKVVAVKAAAPKVPAKPAPKVAPGRAVAAADPTKRKRVLDLDRERRRVQEDEDDVVSQMPPSSLHLDRTASAARSGRQELRERYDKHTETSPAMTGGDVDADWESAYAVGDEAPGGDNPTPDQNVVDDIAAAVGVQYDDNEELEGAERIEERDRHRWEFDPASSDDFDER